MGSDHLATTTDVALAVTARKGRRIIEQQTEHIEGRRKAAVAGGSDKPLVALAVHVGLDTFGDIQHIQAQEIERMDYAPAALALEIHHLTAAHIIGCPYSHSMKHIQILI